MKSASGTADLPVIMVAPNGAKLKKTDHPAIPVAISEIVDTARTCFNAGADGIHAHVRDTEGNHTLDEGLYRELLTELAQAVPDMQHQITTEAVGRYTPGEQMRLVRAIRPGSVSISLAEMTSEGWNSQIEGFYLWCDESDVAVQHILYSQDDLVNLIKLCSSGRIPARNLQMLFVLGRYGRAMPSEPAAILPFLELLPQLPTKPDWAVCAFGPSETQCLLAAERLGGKVRIGFENNTINEDGTIARDNAERIARFVSSRNENTRAR